MSWKAPDYAREIHECRDIIEDQFFEDRERLPDMSDLMDDQPEEDDVTIYSDVAPGDAFRPWD